MCNLVRVLFLHCGICIFHTRVVVSVWLVRGLPWMKLLLRGGRKRAREKGENYMFVFLSHLFSGLVMHVAQAQQRCACVPLLLHAYILQGTMR